MNLLFSTYVPYSTFSFLKLYNYLDTSFECTLVIIMDIISLIRDSYKWHLKKQNIDGISRYFHYGKKTKISKLIEVVLKRKIF